VELNYCFLGISFIVIGPPHSLLPARSGEGDGRTTCFVFKRGQQWRSLVGRMTTVKDEPFDSYLSGTKLGKWTLNSGLIPFSPNPIHSNKSVPDLLRVLIQSL